MITIEGTLTSPAYQVRDVAEGEWFKLPNYPDILYKCAQRHNSVITAIYFNCRTGRCGIDSIEKDKYVVKIWPEASFDIIFKEISR